jgi:hypothetical protein
MIEPGKRICDLCGEPIPEGRKHPLLFYPFTETEMEELARKFSELVPQGAAQMLGGIIPIAVPSHHRFEFCKGCVDGFMPMATELKSAAYERLLVRMERRVRATDGHGKRNKRAFDPDVDDDDE